MQQHDVLKVFVEGVIVLHNERKGDADGPPDTAVCQHNGVFMCETVAVSLEYLEKKHDADVTRRHHAQIQDNDVDLVVLRDYLGSIKV